ncbi:MAG: hypothetical protein B7Z08_01255 [Sphingomonadales bacterium 32-68-7]|nr:MAG: hypothetical protein B7Z33_08590 [Sphingomonadales bacterium 12-68-11]OYX10345.1 MAG: hypothetical protein B7Z08_01255 [Sphingomonadales bacterium 32-68-7]
MKLRLLAAAAALPLLLAAPAVANDPLPSAKDYPAPPAGWKVARTAWGDPDLRGAWPVDYLAATARERPTSMGTRSELTEDEYKQLNGAAEERIGLEAAQDRIGILGMGHWREDGRPLWQNSMITQPANGRYPPLTPVGREAASKVKTSWNTEVFEWVTDFGIFDRCLTRGMPGSMLTGAYNMGIRVMQSPGLVVIATEMIHETRKIYLDGRAAPPAEVTDYLGYSRGRWDGDTLVIETTNFTPGISNGPAPNSAQMKMTERLTPMGPNQMRYEAWIEDPVMLTAPYKIDIPWQRNPNYEFYEYACHEGNVQVRGYITATSPRFQKLRDEQWAKQEAATSGGAP